MEDGSLVVALTIGAPSATYSIPISNDKARYFMRDSPESFDAELEKGLEETLKEFEANDENPGGVVRSTENIADPVQTSATKTDQKTQIGLKLELPLIDGADSWLPSSDFVLARWVQSSTLAAITKVVNITDVKMSQITVEIESPLTAGNATVVISVSIEITESQLPGVRQADGSVAQLNAAETKKKFEQVANTLSQNSMTQRKILVLVIFFNIH